MARAVFMAQSVTGARRRPLSDSCASHSPRSQGALRAVGANGGAAARGGAQSLHEQTLGFPQAQPGKCHQSAQWPGWIAVGSTCADSLRSLSSRRTASARIEADSRSSGSGRFSASFSRAASLAMSRSLAARPSSMSSSASGSRSRPSDLRSAWRCLRLASSRVALGAALVLVERDRLLGALGAELRHVVGPPLEFLVVGHARGVQRLQLGQQRREVAVAGVRHRGDARPRQRVVVGALAELAGVDRDRERDVGHDALVLGASRR